MSYHCKNCFAKYCEEDYESNHVNTLKQSNVFQCQKCFMIGGVIYDFDMECPICCVNKTNRYFSVCGHSICSDCSSNLKKHQCYLCNQESVCATIAGTSNHEYYFDTCDPTIKKCFKKLYYQFNDIAELHLRIHDRLYELCVEYYKFLQLLRLTDNNNAEIKLSPPKIIDQLWHTHLLDNENYNTVCQSICGYILFHYPENSFKNQSDDHNNRYKNTLIAYKTHFGSDIATWIWDNPGSGDIIQLFIKTTASTLTISVPDNSEILTVKKAVEEKSGVPSDQQKLIFAGKQLSNDHDLIYYRIGSCSTIHLVLQMRGC